MRSVTISIAIALGVLASTGTQSAEPKPADKVLQGIDAMRRLPEEGFHLIEAQGQLMLVSTNGHFVVTGGRLIDLWNDVEVTRVADLDRTQRLPLARMGIRAQELGGVSVGTLDAEKFATVFLDPASPETAKLLPQLRSLMTTYRLDVVFVPARAERATVSRALICDHEAASVFLSTGAKPEPPAAGDSCGLKELERARTTVHLLGIRTLPFTVAPNGSTVAGSPDQYSKFVAENQSR